ncbi:tRNA (adenosine(37)-N6)-threonylcarbamoyltransferase complex transferase subunit TsaD [Cyclobacteriaceae bacterium]|nr:tRNA (adenosine(37)-N6)-threonylcarbamoyltransferase complex transferase subunit TsaD [Cyclobacteriaceae bacterium]MDB4742357.1 tRNA (adenosine(37)-N6)-threonylcarbamoyltransferase complex transferase subunit TsaD [Cyclobacteriaceae bacterium]
MKTIILGIESSCDETSASICIDGKVMNNIIATQSIHKEYGGVVPELASRAHQKNIVLVVESALKGAQVKFSDLSAISVTQGPGLLGALMVGYSYAKTLAFALNIPIINVNHMKAHILAHFIETPVPIFPFLCLTVSGGHTQIVKVNSAIDMVVLGSTIDDAVGEAFDKGAKLLGFSYPGGPQIDKYAVSGNPDRFPFSESQIKDLNFSFSGIKTSLLYFLRDHLKNNPDFIKENLEDICASYQKHLISMLMKKLVLAAEKTRIRQIAIAGGVAANKELRTQLKQLSQKHQWMSYIPEFEYCTDNAAMVAISGHLYFQNKSFGQLTDAPQPRMSF